MVKKSVIEGYEDNVLDDGGLYKKLGEVGKFLYPAFFKSIVLNLAHDLKNNTYAFVSPSGIQIRFNEDMTPFGKIKVCAPWNDIDPYGDDGFDSPKATRKTIAALRSLADRMEMDLKVQIENAEE